MAQPFIGEIRVVGFNFAPAGWALCNGQLLSISQNTALFSLLGTAYGGDGRTTFGLPNLQGRAALCQGQGNGLSPYVLGQVGGSEYSTLNFTQMPMHNHGGALNCSAGNPRGNVKSPADMVPAGGASVQVNWVGAPGPNMAPTGNAGNSQPHENRQPFLVLNYVIAVAGIFPQRP
jgi:microcystin-dependent protein